MSCRRYFPHLLSLCLIASTSLAQNNFPAKSTAQRVESLGPEVRKYLRVSTPKVILEHVQIIDGTGAPPTPDRNIYIEGGKITAISEGADQPPSDRVTILDLRGYSVMPGIVGMHNHLSIWRGQISQPTGATTARRCGWR